MEGAKQVSRVELSRSLSAFGGSVVVRKSFAPFVVQTAISHEMYAYTGISHPSCYSISQNSIETGKYANPYIIPSVASQ